MLERIYISLWGIYFIAVGLFYISGLMSAKVLVAFGFVFFGIVFLGIIGVLPFYATHHESNMKH